MFDAHWRQLYFSLSLDRNLTDLPESGRRRETQLNNIEIVDNKKKLPEIEILEKKTEVRICTMIYEMVVSVEHTKTLPLRT